MRMWYCEVNGVGVTGSLNYHSGSGLADDVRRELNALDTDVFVKGADNKITADELLSDKLIDYIIKNSAAPANSKEQRTVAVLLNFISQTFKAADFDKFMKSLERRMYFNVPLFGSVKSNITNVKNILMGLRESVKDTDNLSKIDNALAGNIFKLLDDPNIPKEFFDKYKTTPGSFSINAETLLSNPANFDWLIQNVFSNQNISKSFMEMILTAKSFPNFKAFITKLEAKDNKVINDLLDRAITSTDGKLSISDTMVIYKDGLKVDGQQISVREKFEELAQTQSYTPVNNSSVYNSAFTSTSNVSNSVTTDDVTKVITDAKISFPEGTDNLDLTAVCNNLFKNVIFESADQKKVHMTAILAAMAEPDGAARLTALKAAMSKIPGYTPEFVDLVFSDKTAYLGYGNSEYFIGGSTAIKDVISRMKKFTDVEIATRKEVIWKFTKFTCLQAGSTMQNRDDFMNYVNSKLNDPKISDVMKELGLTKLTADNVNAFAIAYAKKNNLNFVSAVMNASNVEIGSAINYKDLNASLGVQGNSSNGGEALPVSDDDAAVAKAKTDAQAAALTILKSLDPNLASTPTWVANADDTKLIQDAVTYITTTSRDPVLTPDENKKLAAFILTSTSKDDITGEKIEAQIKAMRGEVQNPPPDVEKPKAEITGMQDVKLQTTKDEINACTSADDLKAKGYVALADAVTSAGNNLPKLKDLLGEDSAIYKQAVAADAEQKRLAEAKALEQAQQVTPGSQGNVSRQAGGKININGTATHTHQGQTVTCVSPRYLIDDNSNLIAQIPANAKVTILDNKVYKTTFAGDWYKVKYSVNGKDYVGYIYIKNGSADAIKF